MKTYLLWGAIATVAIALTGGSYSYYLHHTSAAFMVRYDITDDRKANIDTSELPRHIEAVSASWSETSVTFSTFSDFRENIRTAIIIPSAFPLIANPNQRKKELKVAYSKILDTINGLVASNAGRSESVIYEPMAKDLNKLAGLHTHTKEAIFYTDCMQNTTSFSMYREGDRARITTDRDAVKAMFEKQVALASLSGIKIYIIYNSPTPVDESHFLLIGTLWKELFEAHGASVTIGPTLSSN